MDTTLNPKQADPRHVLVARADEELTHAYEQITRADEQIARTEKQLSKLEHDAARAACPGQPAGRLGGQAVRGFTGLMLTACICVAAFVWQSSYGDAARQIIARWAPQLVPTSSLPLENPGLPAQPSPPTVQAAAAKTAPPQPAPLAQTAPKTSRRPPRPVARVDAVAPVDGARSRNPGQGIEQLKASQEQMARDNANAAEQLKASQEQMARQSLPKLPSRTCGPRYQRLRHGRLPPRRASRCRRSRRRKPQRGRRPQRSCRPRTAVVIVAAAADARALAPFFHRNLERRDDLSRRQHSIFTVSVKIQRGGNLTETNRRAGRVGCGSAVIVCSRGQWQLLGHETDMPSARPKSGSEGDKRRFPRRPAMSPFGTRSGRGLLLRLVRTDGNALHGNLRLVIEP